MKTDELRDKYLAFFQSKGHRFQPSDVLVPTWDPSVLFTPAGMNQFKDHFLGKVRLDFTRATTCQKCLRTGDIDNVGRTAYHHTFFEMLGNFSFGDYFKRDAIHWAWEFLTDKAWLGIDPSRLSVTVYKADEEAAEIWHQDIGLTGNRIERLDEDENFWPASAPSNGPDGVCGPCSEIFYHDDAGASVEIWNLVFTQFNRVGDPPDNLRPLPSRNIDTGMGLERTAATLQGVETNFHIDTLRPLVEAAAEVCGRTYVYETEDGRRLRRIADHVRACAMAIHENVYPGPQKEKYVIRRLLRRAVLDGHQMDLREPFLYQLVPVVVEAMRQPYPELTETVERVADVIRNEESNFLGTLDAGLARIERIFEQMHASGCTNVEGREAADLYQTYGVPPEVFETMAAENNLAFDWDGFRLAMDEHGEASGKLSHAVMGDHGPIDAIKKVLHTVKFLGYDALKATAQVKFIVAQHQLIDHLQEIGHESPVQVILDRTPFYGESGGQVGDTGELVGDGFLFSVTDTQKNGDLVIHDGHLIEGEMRAGASVTARVDADRRNAIRRAHSATHLLHHALQNVVGSHAQQQGSKVQDDWFRFDFTNPSAVTPDQIEAIDRSVADRIDEAAPIEAAVLPMAEARQAGAMMLFGEKYPDPVRMVSMGDFSKELCGGTHASNTADIAMLEIVSEESVAAGTRRIVALTGVKAQEHARLAQEALQEAATAMQVDVAQVAEASKSLAGQIRDLKKSLGSGKEIKATPPLGDVAAEQVSNRQQLQRAAKTLKVAPLNVAARVAALLKERDELREKIEHLQQSVTISIEGLLAEAQETAGVRVVVADVAGADANGMRGLIDDLRRNTNPVAVLLGSAQGENSVVLVAGISRDLESRGMHAGNWVREVAEVVGGRGGGKPLMAQAGGKLPGKLSEALDRARQIATASLTDA